MFREFYSTARPMVGDEALDALPFALELVDVPSNLTNLIQTLCVGQTFPKMQEFSNLITAQEEDYLTLFC